MQSIDLIGSTWHDFAPQLRQFADDPANGVVAMQMHGHRIALDFGSSRVYVDRREDARNEYEADEFAVFEARLGSPCFHGIEFSSDRAARAVLLLIADDERFLVDDGYGAVVSGPEFVQLLRQFPEWDWRRERRPFPYPKA